MATATRPCVADDYRLDMQRLSYCLLSSRNRRPGSFYKDRRSAELAEPESKSFESSADVLRQLSEPRDPAFLSVLRARVLQSWESQDEAGHDCTLQRPGRSTGDKSPRCSCSIVKVLSGAAGRVSRV